MKALDGREASVLAIIAQRSDMPEKDLRRLLGALRGLALKTAKAMTGKAKPTPISRAFLAWGKSLSPRARGPSSRGV